MLFGSFRYRRKASPEAGYLYLVILLLVVFMVIGALALGSGSHRRTQARTRE